MPRPLAQLRHQSVLVTKPRSQTRPAPGLIPVQTYSKAGLSQTTVSSSTPTLLTQKIQPSLPSGGAKPILNIPFRPSVKVSSTFTPKVHETFQLQEQEDIPVLSLPEPQGGLDLMDLPQVWSAHLGWVFKGVGDGVHL